MIVADLERALLARFPKTDAEPWDHVGLSVGDPAAEITGVACALDATEANVHRAQEARCQRVVDASSYLHQGTRGILPGGCVAPPVQRSSV